AAATADAALAAADAHARALRRADLAAAIRADLAEGDPCPVCGAEVGAHDVATGDVEEGEAALAAARRAAMAAARAQAEADERLRAATAAAGAARGARDAAGCGLAAAGVAPEEAAERAEALAGRAEGLGPAIAAARAGVEAEVRAVAAEGSELTAEAASIDRDAAELQAAHAALGAWAREDDARAALRAAIAEVGSAEAARADADRVAREAAAGCADADRALAGLVAGPVAQLRAVTARVAARGGFAAPADDAEPADLVAAAVRMRAAALEAADRHDAAAAAAEGRADAARSALATAGAGLGVEDGAQVDGAVRRLAGVRDAARARLRDVEEAAAEARRLRADAAAARTRARVHAQVANDLRANMFPRFLLNRFQERLAAGASVRLQELSGGDYWFAGSGADALAVVDKNRGERVRKASTLSGGEKFLASLALALGLSDVAAESGGRLDCLFLDEGFSTLDADALEQAMAGIERLAGDGRLVAVITHLPGVADRLGAAIHVEKDVAGVSRIRSGGDQDVVPSGATAMMPA
ncbi:MAG TPA: SbcC/MukB-like Walker B domain-containing protein, partial [Miltoncostaea sp.]|nr:SbcC/MukB-like Walker B domain-containing protein [Miltoncostaea sp.]